MSMSLDGNAVILPPGVQVSSGRETVQAGPNGQNVQGMMFILTLPNNAQTTVFVPYSLMNSPVTIAQMFADRVNAIMRIESLGGS